MGLGLLNVLLDFPREDPIVLLQANRGRLDDKCLGDFAAFLVGDLDNGTVGDGRVSEKMGLEFCGSDLVTLIIALTILYQKKKIAATVHPAIWELVGTDLDLDKLF